MNRSLPRYLPMLAKPCRGLPSQTDGYAAEVKWDGIRAMVYSKGGAVQIMSRNGFDMTFRYPELARLAQEAGQDALILDGEIVAFSEAGAPSFSLLQRRMSLEKPALIEAAQASVPITFVIFDLLQLGNKSLIRLPYEVRRQVLEEQQLSGPAWITPSYQTGQVRAFLSASQELGLEGIILKRIDSPYLPGKRSDAWLKVKNMHRQEFVIGGWTPGQGKRSGTIGALLLGYYQPAERGESEPKLVYAGSCGTGFSEKTLTELQRLFLPLTITYCPFRADPHKQGATFVQPIMVGEFSFTEWTPSHTLRHPSFLGLREDKEAVEVIKELP